MAIVTFKKGSTDQNNLYKGQNGELTIDTTLKTLRIHDGTTIGGFEVALANLSNTAPNTNIDLNGNDITGVSNISSNGGNLIMVSPTDFDLLATFLSGLVAQNNIQVVSEAPDSYSISTIHDSNTTFSVDSATGDINTDGDIYVAGSAHVDGTVYADVGISTHNGDLVLSSQTGQISIENNMNIEGDINITGNFTIQGETATINSNVVVIDDPVFILGGENPPLLNDSKDRGIEFKWHDGTSAITPNTMVMGQSYYIVSIGDTDFTQIGADSNTVGLSFTYNGDLSQAGTTGTGVITTASKIGFFGYDNSTGKFIFIKNASKLNDVYSGDAANVIFGGGEFTDLSVTNTITGSIQSADTLTNARTISLSGDVTGSVNFDGSGNVDITTSIANNSVALGTDTTGDYVTSLVAGAGITLTNNSGEGATPTVALTSGIATAGTYKSVTVDTYGRVTAGTNPTTLSGYGITDAVDTSNSQTIAGTKTFSGSIAFSGSGAITLSSTSTATTQTALDNSTKIATTAYVQTATRVAVNTQTANYTLVIGDEGKMIEFNSASNLTLTIPANSSVAFPVGTQILISRYGTGTVQVLITTDTLRSASSNRFLASQYSAATLVKRTSTEWYLFGDLSAT